MEKIRRCVCPIDNTKETLSDTAMRLAQRNAAKRGNNDGASGRQNGRRQKSANVVKIHIDVEIGFFAVLPFVNAHSTRQFCSSSVQRNKHRRRYVVGAFPQIHWVPRRGHRGGLPSVPERFSYRLVRHTVDRYKVRPGTAVGELQIILWRDCVFADETVFTRE